MKKIRLGIIGIGNMGSAHAKNIKLDKCPDFDITAIADTNKERLSWAKEQGYGNNIAYFDDDIAMLDSGLIDACLIAVPHYDHTWLAIECMKRSIHVMLEKPAGVYTKQVLEMNKVADEHPEVIFGMMFNQRTSPVYQKLRELVSSGKYGAIRRTNWLITTWYRPQAYYNSGGWRATWAGEGGGVLLNQCPHQLDLWQWIFGMPKRIRAFCSVGKWHNIEVEDDATIYAEYENGAVATFITSTGEYPGTNRLEISGDLGKLVIEEGHLKWWKLNEPERQFCFTSDKGFFKPETEFEDIVPEAPETAHRGVLQAFTDAILSGGDLVAHGSEGLNELTLSNAAYLSAWTDDWVELPLDHKAFADELDKRISSSKPHSGKSEKMSKKYNERWSVRW